MKKQTKKKKTKRVGWGVGGIEAEAVMLNQPISMVLPEVIGYKLVGKLSPQATATDLVLAITKNLRDKGVVEKFVEFYGPGVGELSIADRATIANMVISFFFPFIFFYFYFISIYFFICFCFFDIIIKIITIIFLNINYYF